MKLQYISIMLVVISSLCYHLFQKATPSNSKPIVALIVTYSVALIFSIIILLISDPKLNIVYEFRKTNWVSILLGFAIVGLELGFLLVYRTGFNISIASLLANTIIALLLIPAGYLLYKESFSLINMSGVLLCITGLILITK